MVKEYLEKIKQEYLENSIQLKDEIHTCENKIKENIQFIEVLEESRDPHYEAFTPRQINGFNQKKIAELNEEQKLLTDRLTELRERLGEIDCKIDEVTSVIKAVKEEESFVSKEYDSNMRMEILRTVEAERQRIAMDLHDVTIQDLTSLMHKTELCTKLLDVDPMRCKLEFSSITKILRDTIENTRKLIHDLRPIPLNEDTFDIAIERELEKFHMKHDFICNYHLEGTPHLLGHMIQITLLHVFQEICANVVKHAEAFHMDVYLIYEENQFILRVVDDGKGFDMDAVSNAHEKDNFGISMMKERVYLLSGSIDIQSAPLHGCTITITIPYQKGDSECQ